MAAGLKVRQQPQFLERGEVERLRLVDDQQGTPPGARGGMQAALDPGEQLGLGHAVGIEVEPVRHHAQQVVGLDLGRGDADGEQALAIDRRHQMADERGLAGADLAGDDDEALTLRQAITKIGHRLFVRRRVEPETRIWRQLERSAAQSVMFVVHLTVPNPALGGSCFRIDSACPVGPGRKPDYPYLAR